MHKGFIKTAAIFGLLSVALGAFAAHALKELLSDYAVNIFETGVRYQFYHVFALLFLATISTTQNKFLNWSFWCFVIGIILFSGSLYLIATKNLFQIQQISVLGPLTPVGGLFFIGGWLSLLLSTLKNK